MLSVIICTRDKDISLSQRKNIEESVGAEVEIVVIDNSADHESIFSAYNNGVKQAKGDLICFIHDDVLFRTEDWGKIIEKHFHEDERLGLIGFAGAHFLPSTPMYWDESPFISEYDLTTRNGQTEKCFFLEHFGESMSIEVAAVDGLCFFVRKELFQTILFDEKNYKGFHMYDMDLCMQVRDAGYKVCVCRDILVEHFYNGSASKAGYELLDNNLKLFYNKWSSHFPMAIGLDGISDGMIAQLDRFVKQRMSEEKVLHNIQQSKAYRLGKALLKPLKSLNK